MDTTKLLIRNLCHQALSNLNTAAEFKRRGDEGVEVSVVDDNTLQFKVRRKVGLPEYYNIKVSKPTG